MAKKQQDDDLLMDDELTAAFLGDDGGQAPSSASTQQSQDEWLDEENLPGQLAVDVYDTKDKVYVQAPIAGVNKDV